MYEQKMDSTFSEELEAMEALEAYVSRLFFYDVHDLDCAAPQQERVTPKFCVKSNECRNRAKFICRRQRLDRLPPMSTT